MGGSSARRTTARRGGRETPLVVLMIWNCLAWGGSWNSWRRMMIILTMLISTFGRTMCQASVHSGRRIEKKRRGVLISLVKIESILQFNTKRKLGLCQWGEDW